jgi:jumonji domain-containing protein 7
MTSQNDTIAEEYEELFMLASPQALHQLNESVSSLWCPPVLPILTKLPSPLQFYRNQVAKSRPCIFRNVLDDLPRWTVDDVLEICGADQELTVNITPDGHGDAIRTIQTDQLEVQKRFVLPLEHRMRLTEFCTSLRASVAPYKEGLGKVDAEELQIFPEDTTPQENSGADNISSSPPKSVYYYSMQNDCLRTELPCLIPLLNDQALQQFGEQVFGTGPPDAINLWMGNEKAVSSIHKDYYENLFYVASGEKVFDLYPPADAPFLTTQSLPTSRFHFRNNVWCVVPHLEDNGELHYTPWIHLDAAKTNYLHYLTVKVQAGDILYLPSLWFHQVTQTCETVGINWWFDMHFDSPHFCYFQLLQECQLVSRNDNDTG